MVTELAQYVPELAGIKGRSKYMVVSKRLLLLLLLLLSCAFLTVTDLYANLHVVLFTLTRSGCVQPMLKGLGA